MAEKIYKMTYGVKNPYWTVRNEDVEGTGETIEDVRKRLPDYIVLTFSFSDEELNSEDFDAGEYIRDRLFDDYGSSHDGFESYVLLSQEELENVFNDTCPYCGSENIDCVDECDEDSKWECYDCDNDFLVDNETGECRTRNGFKIEKEETENV